MFLWYKFIGFNMYVYSKLPTDIDFCIYEKTPDGMNLPQRFIQVKGNNGQFVLGQIETSKGTVTQLYDSDYELIKDQFVFKHMVNEGFYSVDTAKTEIEAHAKDMAEPSVQASMPLDSNIIEQKYVKTENGKEVPTRKGIEVKVIGDK